MSRLSSEGLSDLAWAIEMELRSFQAERRPLFLAPDFLARVNAEVPYRGGILDRD